MATTVQFFVDDTSPSFSYLPYAEKFTNSSLQTAWNPFFTKSKFVTDLGEVVKGESWHITALDGAVISFKWTGTGVQLFGKAINATYTVSLDGVVVEPDYTSADGQVLAAFSDLPNTSHTLQLTTSLAKEHDSYIAFNTALVTAPPPHAHTHVTYVNQTINDSEISFSGSWSLQRSTYSGIARTFKNSTNVGDLAVTKFNGTTFLLTGLLSPHGGNFSVTVDNSTSFVSARSSFSHPDALLYFESGLDENIEHDVQIKNEDGAVLALALGGFNTINLAKNSSVTPGNNTNPYRSHHNPAGSMTMMSSLTNSSPASKAVIIGLSILGGLVVLMSGSFFFYLFYLRTLLRRRESGHHPESNMHCKDLCPKDNHGSSGGGTGKVDNGDPEKLEISPTDLHATNLTDLPKRSSAKGNNNQKLALHSNKTIAYGSKLTSSQSNGAQSGSRSRSLRAKSFRASFLSMTKSSSSASQTHSLTSTAKSPFPFQSVLNISAAEASDDRSDQSKPPKRKRAGSKRLLLNQDPHPDSPPPQDDEEYEYADPLGYTDPRPSWPVRTSSLAAKTPRRRILSPREQQVFANRSSPTVEAVHEQRGSFLGVRPTTPLNVNFAEKIESANRSGAPERSLADISPRLGLPAPSRMRERERSFNSTSPRVGPQFGKGKGRAADSPSETSPVSRNQLSPQSHLRLTPPPTAAAARQSFLEFGSSSGEGSVLSCSNESDSRRNTVYTSAETFGGISNFPSAAASLVAERSKWSTTDSIAPSNPATPALLRPQEFDFPVVPQLQLPSAQPNVRPISGSVPPSSYERAIAASYKRRRTTSSKSNGSLPHLTIPHPPPAFPFDTALNSEAGSPTESISWTVSDINFRVSDSEDDPSRRGSVASQMPNTALRMSPLSPLGGPNPASARSAFIVQQVLGYPRLESPLSNLGRHSLENSRDSSGFIL